MLDLCSPDLLRLLVDHATTAVAIFDRRFCYIAANDHHLVAYGLAGEGDIIGVSHEEIAGSLPEGWQESRRTCIEEGQELCTGRTSVLAPGAPWTGQHELSWQMHPWRDATGDLAGVVVFTTFYALEAGEQVPLVTERLQQAENAVRRAREELAAARSEVLEASRVKSAFLATMSHELRTPLASILLFCEMLQEDAVADGNMSLAEDLARVVGAGQQLRGLIDDLLEFSKLESGRSRIDASPFDVAELLHNTASAMRPLLDKTGNTMEVRCASDLGVMVSDAGKVKQSLINLISNACKFTENGRITLEGTREMDNREQEMIVINVVDTGIGISTEVLPRLFQDFVQGDPSLTRKYGGTGLGLAMTRRYVEMLGGTVRAESEPGQGAIFTIRLPVDVTQ